LGVGSAVLLEHSHHFSPIRGVVAARTARGFGDRYLGLLLDSVTLKTAVGPPLVSRGNRSHAAADHSAQREDQPPEVSGEMQHRPHVPSMPPGLAWIPSSRPRGMLAGGNRQVAIESVNGAARVEHPMTDTPTWRVLDKEQFMTYSTGPGGYGGPPQGPSTPGYGPQSPGYGPAPAPGEGKGLPFFLHIGVIALGVISFFAGFAPYISGSSAQFGGESISISASYNFFATNGVVSISL